VIAALVIGVLWPAGPVDAQGSGRGGGEPGWAARRIGASGAVRARDRGMMASLPDAARVGYHPATKRVRFLSGTRARPLGGGLAAAAAGQRRLTSREARGRARSFIDRYGTLFGIEAPGRDLRIDTVSRGALPVADGGPTPSRGAGAQAPRAGRAQARRAGGAEARHGGRAGRPAPPIAAAPARRPATVRFVQLRRGVPVIGGEIAVQVAEDGAILSASGEVMPSGTEVATRPRIGEARARRTAAGWMARGANRPRPAVRVRSEGLGIYDPRLMDDPMLAGAGARLVWRIEAAVAAAGDEPAEVRLILVDARRGDVLTSISRVVAVDRHICDNRGRPGWSYRCGRPYARTEGERPTGVRDVDAAYRLLGVVDEFLRSRFGRDGLDGEGARMTATVRYCNPYGCPWRNAQWKWREQQSIFGVGWARADDIVGHELAHGLLDHEVPLFYHFQSGAINESMADVFGELIDLSYGGGTDTSSSAWRIGEDTPIGAFRDMQHPGRHGHPDRVRSRRWHVGAADDGGVHRNSGVGNKAAYLIAQGGRFNGRTIRGVGRTRAARIYYQALTTRLTPAANYVDLGDALVAACTDLVGSFGIVAAHCASVREATRATQMHRVPRNAPQRAPLCPAGRSPVDVLFDDLEDPDSGRWVSQRLAGTRRGWYYPQNPNNDPAWDATWASSGRYNFYAPNRGRRSDTVMRTRTARELPEGAYLRFEHGYSFDSDARRRYDGGVVEIKIGGGPWRDVRSRFTHGGYVGRIAQGRGNPLAGRRAFTGNSRGWASARVDLADLAGRDIKVRFRMASDRSFGGRGWYIDDIRIYACTSDAEPPD
jgi:hypothetical protein